MVLGTLTARWCALGWLCLLCAGCSRTSEAQSATDAKGELRLVADQTEVNRINLQILNSGDTCTLRAGGAAILLQPKAPCFFLRRGGKVQTYAYSDVNTDFVVIIGGTALSDDKRKTWNLKQGEVCGEAAQAVLRKNGEVRPTKAVRTGGVYCKELGVDEKDFWSFAHDPE